MSAPLPTLPFTNLRRWAADTWAYTQTAQFGNAVIVLFFVAQALDGALTYVGVTTLGMDVEANPLLFWLMGAAGHGAALALAKLTAAGFGIVLHLCSVHRAVAILTAFYVSAAVLPWVAVLSMTIDRGLL